MMNPQSMMQLLGALGTFKSSHPKFASFRVLMIKGGVPEDSVIEVTVTRPGEESVTANMKVLASDIQLMQALNLKP